MSRALVIGANRGIGLEIVNTLRARGYEVVATCRSRSEALDDMGVRVIEGVDVTDTASLRELADALAGAQLDLVIHNAGILSRQAFDGIDEQAVADIEAQFRVNAIGPLLTAQAVQHNLHEGSRFGIVTSRMGSLDDNTSGGHYGYRMSKAAANMVGRSLAHDLGQRGVLVALLHPGYVQTAMTGNQGNVGPDHAARGLVDRLEAVDSSTSGRFWHADGGELPW